MNTIFIPGPTGRLELVSCLPLSTDSETLHHPILFIHGAFCSAHDYALFLPFFAAHNHPAYALSIRNHGGSLRPGQGWVRRMLLTGVGDWVQDVGAAVDFVAAAADVGGDDGGGERGARKVILAGHSLGGGVVQAFVNAASSGLIAGLVLLSAVPLAGAGLRIYWNWSAVDAELVKVGAADAGAKSPLTHTPRQVKAAFLGEGTGEDVAERWLRECKTAEESARAVLGSWMRLGEAGRVLAGLEGVGGGDGGGGGRKVLCVFGSADRLITPEMNRRNVGVYRYRAALREVERGEAVMVVEIEGAGHHLMMDSKWEEVARGILAWVSGEALESSRPDGEYSAA